MIIEPSFKFIENSQMNIILPFIKLLNKNLTDKLLYDRLDIIIKQNFKCIGIYFNKDIVGVCDIDIFYKFYAGKILELDNFIILPNYRNLDIGKKFIVFIEDFAKKIDCDVIELNSYSNNLKAHKFFKSNTFNVIASHLKKRL